MAVLLSSADIARLNNAARILLSPFAFESGAVWRHEAGLAIAPLVNASRVLSGMTVPDEQFYTGDEDVVRGLSSSPIPDFVYRGAVHRRVDLRLDVADWTELYDVQVARASGFYEEIVRPLEILAPLAIFTELPGLRPSPLWNPPLDGGRTWSLVMLGFCFPDEATAFSNVERNRAVLQLLTPSFAAGVRAYVHARRYKAAFTDLVDRILEPIAICEATGRPIYHNRALSELLLRDAEHSKISSALEHAAATLSALRVRTRLKSASAYDLVDYRTSDVRTTNGQYHIHVALVEGGVHGLKDSILAFVEQSNAMPSSYADVATRYGLTRRETDVLQLLCTGASTRQIATKLQISLNTARRHVEHVLSKLGVHSRTAAIAMLDGRHTNRD